MELSTNDNVWPDRLLGIFPVVSGRFHSVTFVTSSFFCDIFTTLFRLMCSRRREMYLRASPSALLRARCMARSVGKSTTTATMSHNKENCCNNGNQQRRLIRGRGDLKFKIIIGEYSTESTPVHTVVMIFWSQPMRPTNLFFPQWQSIASRIERHTLAGRIRHIERHTWSDDVCTKRKI